MLSFQDTAHKILWPFKPIFSTLVALIFLVQQQKPLAGLYLTYKHIISAIISVTDHNPVSAVEWYWSSVSSMCSSRPCMKNCHRTQSKILTVLFCGMMNITVWLGILLTNWQTCILCVALQMETVKGLCASARKHSHQCHPNHNSFADTDC
jgi:hypothetical protein